MPAWQRSCCRERERPRQEMCIFVRVVVNHPPEKCRIDSFFSPIGTHAPEHPQIYTSARVVGISVRILHMRSPPALTDSCVFCRIGPWWLLQFPCRCVD